jgi:DNA integrity scanning protein DisA with diadenylate cyclase activity
MIMSEMKIGAFGGVVKDDDFLDPFVQKGEKIEANFNSQYVRGELGKGK